MKLTLNKIIEDIFFNDTQIAIDKLREYNLYDIIEKHINSINADLNNFNTVATSLISSVNSILRNVSNLEDKAYLEYLISDIANFIIKKFFSEGTINHNEIASLDEQIKTICNLYDYNYVDFQKLIPLKKISEYITINQSRKENNKPVYYEWNTKINLLDELAKNLKSEQIIYSVKDFKKLFSSKPIEVVFNKEKVNFIIILFDELYNFGFIKPKVKKGHFIALKHYSIDQDKISLFEKEIKHLNYSIKKNEMEYNKTKSKIKNWLDLR